MEKNYSYEDFLEIVAKLRSEGGCPWDRQQTHESLRSCMIEEAYEFLSSVRILKESGSGENMCEELGDLLLQVVMHARIAEEEGLFSMQEVVDGVARKMVRRHPHVFSEAQIDGVADVLTNWEEIKKREKEGKAWIASPLREIPAEHPALTRASKVLKKINKTYEPIPDYQTAVSDAQKTLERLAHAGETIGEREIEEGIGELLMGISTICALRKISAEQLLTDCIEETINRYEK